MKLSVYIVILSAIGSCAAALTEELSKLEMIQNESGASFELLSQYDSLIKHYSSDPSIYKAYEKLGYIQLFMNKESQTIESFEKSLELNYGSISLKKNLFDLYFKFGLADRFNQTVSKLKLAGKDPLVEEYQQKFAEIDHLVANKDLDAAINLSPHNSNLRSLRIESTISNMPKKDHSKQLEQFENLIDDYLNLIKSSKLSSSMSDNLRDLSLIYIFNNLEVKNSNALLKKCLQYDMEDKKSIKLSKFLNKYSHILETLSKYNEIFQAWADKEEANDIQDIDEKEIAEILQSLNSKEKFIKIRRVNDKHSTNLGFLNEISNDFNQHFKVQKNTIDLTVLKLELLNSLLRNNEKSFNHIYKKLVKLDPSQEYSLPVLIHKIDAAFKASNYNKVHELLNSATANMKKSKLLKPRLTKFQHYQNQQQRQRQQQQQQQQQQYQQRQRQQQQSAQGPPKNDYYKILGIPKSATQPEIKKAYREMTKQYHPDKYKGDLSKDDIEHKMTQINHAYEVLSDEKSKKDYDQFGDDPNDTDRQNNGGHGGGDGGGFAQRAQFRQGGQFGGFNGGSFGGFGGFGGFGNARTGQRAGGHRKS
jgi:DnaJ family protein C protein 3